MIVHGGLLAVAKGMPAVKIYTIPIACSGCSKLSNNFDGVSAWSAGARFSPMMYLLYLHNTVTMARKAKKQPIALANWPPLHNWGVFAERYWHTVALSKDRMALLQLAYQNEWKHQWDFGKLLLQGKKVILVTDPVQTIIFASSNMFEMSGYLPQEVKGKKPSIFQGSDTSERTRMEIREAIRQQKEFDVSLLNYRKLGGVYNCHIEGHPVFNKAGQLSHFIAFENETGDQA